MSDEYSLPAEERTRRRNNLLEWGVDPDYVTSLPDLPLLLLGQIAFGMMHFDHPSLNDGPARLLEWENEFIALVQKKYSEINFEDSRSAQAVHSIAEHFYPRLRLIPPRLTLEHSMSDGERQRLIHILSDRGVEPNHIFGFPGASLLILVEIMREWSTFHSSDPGLKELSRWEDELIQLVREHFEEIGFECPHEGEIIEAIATRLHPELRFRSPKRLQAWEKKHAKSRG